MSRSSWNKKEITYDIDEHGCWLCTSHYLCRGYPHIFHNGKVSRLNRVVLEKTLGRPIKDGMYALHRCNNRRCINPEHLYEGSQVDNMIDLHNAGTRTPIRTRHTLTEDAVLQIRSSEEDSRVLASRFGISRNHIYKIRRNEQWRSVHV